MYTLFVMHFSAFVNSVTNAGNTNARITKLRELGIILKEQGKSIINIMIRDIQKQ